MYAYVRQDGKGLIAISVVLTQDVSKVPARKGLMEEKNHGHVTAMKVTGIRRLFISPMLISI